MTKFSNSLNPAQIERLVMLAEEAGEVIQAVTKILRHGYESYHPNEPTKSNKVRLQEELADLLAVASMLDDAREITVPGYLIAISKEKKKKYTHHQD